MDDAHPVTHAVLDVGTNSVKLLLARRGRTGGWETVGERVAVTRLGEGISETGAIAPAALDRTASTIAAMVSEARAAGVRDIVVVGTAGLRIATNSEHVVDEIRRRSGVTVEIITGEEESRIAFDAARSGLGLGTADYVVFDTGGGSSQFTFGHGAGTTDRFSVNVGAVRYTEAYGLGNHVPDEILEDVQTAIEADFRRIEGRTPETMIVLGGAATTMAAVALGLTSYDPEAVHGFRLASTEVDRQVRRFASMDVDERRTIVGLQPDRAEVILAGACIVRTAMDRLGQAVATVSDRGLRHGILLDRFGP